MTIYIGLLRGINVGGHHKVKMADLKSTLEKIGLLRVQTYIQSGNVLFESSEEEQTLREKIEHELAAAFGFPIPVMLRTAAELETILNQRPFSETDIAEAKEGAEGEVLYVAHMLEAPTAEGLERLERYRSSGEQYRVEGRDMYLLFQRTMRNSKLADNLPKVGVPVTVRNWNTVTKLVALAQSMKI